MVGAVGTRDKNAFQVPVGMVGIYAVACRGAGVESLTIEFSDGSQEQVIPGVDIAEQTDLTEAQFCVLNKPLAPGTQIHVLAEGTGTAACHTYLIFAEALSGTQNTWIKGTINTATAATNDKIADIPTFISRVERVFGRSVNGEGIGIKLGAGAVESMIPVRHIALNTDAVPFMNAFTELRAPVPPGGKILLGTNDSGTGGASAFYFVMT